MWVDMKKFSKFSSGALVLLLSGIICKCLGAFFRLPLTNLLGIEGIGIFQLIMSLYAFALVITCGGVTASLSKLISSARATGKQEKISIYLRHSMLLTVGIGVVVGGTLALCGKYIAFLQGISEGNSYFLFVILLPLGGELATLRGFFQGYENMTPTAISQVIEQVFRFATGLLFAFYFAKISVIQGVFGAFLGVIVSEAVSLIYLLIFFYFKHRKPKEIYDISLLQQARKEFNRANFPLTISASIIPLVNAFDGLIIIPRLLVAGLTTTVATKLYGIQTGVVGAILNFPLIISVAVTTALLPNISFLISKGTGGKNMIEKGLKILLYLILPTTFGMVAIAKPVLSLIYTDMNGTMLEIAFYLMFYGAFSIVFTAIMQFLIMLLQANGQFNYILCITFIGGAVKALLTFFLSSVPSINIFALVIGNLAMNSIVCLCALAKLKSLVTFKLSLAEILWLLLGTALMYVTVYTFVISSKLSAIASVIIGILLGLLVYGVVTISFLTKLMKKQRKTV